MNLASLETRTTVEASPEFRSDSLTLNGRRETGAALERVKAFLDLLREMSGKTIYAHVTSENNFPSIRRHRFIRLRVRGAGCSRKPGYGIGPFRKRTFHSRPARVRFRFALHPGRICGMACGQNKCQFICRDDRSRGSLGLMGLRGSDHRTAQKDRLNRRPSVLLAQALCRQPG